MSGFKSDCGSESAFGRDYVVRCGYNFRNGLRNGCGLGSWFGRDDGPEDTFREASEAGGESGLGGEWSFMNAFGR